MPGHGNPIGGGTSGDVSLCYVSGTRLRTPHGDRAIESLQATNEIIVRRDEQLVIEHVKWVGLLRVDLTRHAQVEDAAPIRIRKNAVADNQPARDLLVSPEHCLIIDDACVSAKLLINGASIVSERTHPPFTYYHVELEKHGILLAENLPAESYLDTGNRCVFDNSGAPRLLHPHFKLDADAGRWQVDACAPLATAKQAKAIWSRLARRSVLLGFARAKIKLVHDADIHLVADGQALRPLTDSGSTLMFVVPAGVTAVSLDSRCCIPSDKMTLGDRDTRRLGIRVEKLSIQVDDVETVFSADHPSLTTGWHDAETDGRTTWRWTNGTAIIPWQTVTGSAMLKLRCQTIGAYPVYAENMCLVA